MSDIEETGWSWRKSLGKEASRPVDGIPLRPGNTTKKQWSCFVEWASRSCWLMLFGILEMSILNRIAPSWLSPVITKQGTFIGIRETIRLSIGKRH